MTLLWLRLHRASLFVVAPENKTTPRSGGVASYHPSFESARRIVDKRTVGVAFAARYRAAIPGTPMRSASGKHGCVIGRG